MYGMSVNNIMLKNTDENKDESKPEDDTITNDMKLKDIKSYDERTAYLQSRIRESERSISELEQYIVSTLVLLRNTQDEATQKKLNTNLNLYRIRRDELRQYLLNTKPPGGGRRKRRTKRKRHSRRRRTTKAK